MRKKRTCFSVLMLLSFFLSLQCFLFAQEAPKREVRVGWLEVTGSITKEDYENESGYARNYLDKIALYNNWKLVFVKESFANLYPMLLSGEIDIIPSFGYSEERAQLVFYPNMEMSYAYTTLYVKQESLLSGNNLSALNHTRIGALSPDEINKVKLDEFAKENKLYFSYDYFASYDDIRQAVVDGRVTAGIEPNHKDDDETKTILQIDPRKGYLACTPVDQSIVNGVNFAQEKLLEVNPNFLNDLMKRYHPRSIPTKFVLSREEQDTIYAAKPLRVLVGNRWQPYEFYDARTKSFSGYIVDLFKKVSDITGLDFDFVYEGTYSDTAVDIVALSENNLAKAEKKGYKITEPFLSLPFTLIYKGKPKLEDGKTAVVEGISLNSTDFKSFTSWTSDYYQNANACLEALRKGKVDQTILDSFTANYEIERKRKFSNLSVQIMDESFDLCTLVHEDIDPVIFHVLNKSLFYASASYSNFLLLQNAYKSNEIGLGSIINKMPLDIVLLFVILFFIIVIVFILYRAKYSKEKLEIKKNLQLQEALMSAESANEAKTNFTSRISHEIRSPLNAVIGYMSLAKVEEKNPLAINYLAKAETAAKQLLTLLNDVLDMSRIESGKLQISKKSFVLSDVIDILSTLFYNESTVAGLDFVVLQENVAHEQLLGDQLRLLQVLTNLLSNAIKFTPRGGKVIFSIKEEQFQNGIVYMQFSVQDTGVGISPTFLEKIFSPYERQSMQNNMRVAGTGLGLAITKNIVNLMDGTIRVESKVGEGSTFTVLLPFEIETVEKESESKEDTSLTQKQIEEKLCFEGKKVLVVEDNEMNTEIISAILNKYKIEIDTAVNGEEALSLFMNTEAKPYDLILMDIQMPVLDGYEATKKIRSSNHPQAKTIPIVAMTAHAFVEDVSRSLACGMNSHLTKPIDVHELLKTLLLYFEK